MKSPISISLAAKTFFLAEIFIAMAAPDINFGVSRRLSRQAHARITPFIVL